MKREGRQQHGYVRNCWILPAQLNNNSSSTRGVLNSSSPPLGGAGGGLMNNIPTSPTAGAKPWKCAGKYKTRIPKNIKGTQKLKSLDVATNHKLISWRVVDKGCDLNYRGISATDMLLQLNNRDRDYWVDDEQDKDLNNQNQNHDYYDDDVYNNTVYDVNNNVDDEDLGTELTKLGPVRLVMKEEESDADEEEDYEDDDHMSFCDVGFVVDQLDEEDWCLVEEM
ncbi:hypothetical protein MKX03_002317 [Papaver bracteatum]|nr:hypothetical protein MKX03_002317 [Papaver bracteatum]